MTDDERRGKVSNLIWLSPAAYTLKLPVPVPVPFYARLLDILVGHKALCASEKGNENRHLFTLTAILNLD